MGRRWDGWESPASYQRWTASWATEAFRVLKPGGHLIAFGGSRTYHRLACAIEDAGFEIRDTIMYLYGSGFPKSLDVSRAIDRELGAERTEVVGVRPGHEDFVGRTDDHAGGGRSEGWDRPWRDDPEAVAATHVRTAPATSQAAEYNGWGTALKPAHEPIVLARKPLIGTVASNVLRHGTGGLNIDGTRISGAVPATTQGQSESQGIIYGSDQRDQRSFVPDVAGRWPANVVLTHHDDCVPRGTTTTKGITGGYAASTGRKDGTQPIYGAYEGLPESSTRVAGGKRIVAAGVVDEDGMEAVEVWDCHPDCPVGMLDRQTGTLKSGKAAAGGHVYRDNGSMRGDGGIYAGGKGLAAGKEPGDSAGVLYGDAGGASRFFYTSKVSTNERHVGMEGARNNHPTVKPVDLMRWLCRLVTPPGDSLVLDPFCGSGSTGMAAVIEGFRFVGIDNDADYCGIARKRIGYIARGGTLVPPAPVPRQVDGQVSLFD